MFQRFDVKLSENLHFDSISFQDWCQQRQLLMLVIALNVSLATMFFNLLSQ